MEYLVQSHYSRVQSFGGKRGSSFNSKQTLIMLFDAIRADGFDLGIPSPMANRPIAPNAYQGTNKPVYRARVRGAFANLDWQRVLESQLIREFEFSYLSVFLSLWDHKNSEQNGPI